MLVGCHVWIADGTFKSCPKVYKRSVQLYTIHGVIQSVDDKKIFHLCQSVFRHAQTIGLQTAFTSNVEVRKQILGSR